MIVLTREQCRLNVSRSPLHVVAPACATRGSAPEVRTWRRRHRAPSGRRTCRQSRSWKLQAGKRRTGHTISARARAHASTAPRKLWWCSPGSLLRVVAQELVAAPRPRQTNVVRRPDGLPLETRWKGPVDDEPRVRRVPLDPVRRALLPRQPVSCVLETATLGPPDAALNFQGRACGMYRRSTTSSDTMDKRPSSGDSTACSSMPKTLPDVRRTYLHGTSGSVGMTSMPTNSGSILRILVVAPMWGSARISSKSA